MPKTKAKSATVEPRTPQEEQGVSAVSDTPTPKTSRGRKKAVTAEEHSAAQPAKTKKAAKQPAASKAASKKTTSAHSTSESQPQPAPKRGKRTQAAKANVEVEPETVLTAPTAGPKRGGRTKKAASSATPQQTSEQAKAATEPVEAPQRGRKGRRKAEPSEALSELALSESAVATAEMTTAQLADHPTESAIAQTTSGDTADAATETVSTEAAAPKTKARKTRSTAKRSTAQAKEQAEESAKGQAKRKRRTATAGAEGETTRASRGQAKEAKALAEPTARPATEQPVKQVDTEQVNTEQAAQTATLLAEASDVLASEASNLDQAGDLDTQTPDAEPLVLQRPKRSKKAPRQQVEADAAVSPELVSAALNLDTLSLETLDGVEPVEPQSSDILASLLPDLPALTSNAENDITAAEAASSAVTAVPLSDPVQELLVSQLRSIGRPIHVRDLEKSFTRQKARMVGNWRSIEAALEELTRTGLVIRTRKKTYGLPDAMNLVRGRFQASAAGFGFVVPDSGREDYYVAPEDTMEAWNGDTVLVRPEGHGARGSNFGRRGGRFDGNPQASVVRIVQRAYSQLVGTLEYSHGYPILKADDFRARHRILLASDGLEELASGARVVADLYWPEATGEDEVFGAVSRVLGEEDDPETETEAVMVKYGLRGEFPPEVLAEAQSIPRDIPEEALRGRLDLRQLNTFTVDGRDAKDFDDAIHIQPTEQGTFLLGVHIADVSHYVQAGSALDGEAYARATSVYLPGRVLPMLPEHLSNGVCSLVPYEDRLTMSALVELSADADILNVELSPSVIHSKARLTYDEVQAYSEGTSPMPEHARHLEGDLHLLLKVTSRLRQKRLREGSLDFKMREVKVDVDAEGRMELIPLREETARGMIEDLMLLANKVVAGFLLERKIPTLFRIHEEPTMQRFQDVSQAIGRLGLSFPGGEPTPQAYQDVLKQVRGTGRESVVNTLLLRSMQQAKYAGENLGHFGLAFDQYLHFTSPIRRYPDLMVHRVLRGVLGGELRTGSREVDQLRSVLPAMGEHTSDRERNAAEAERDLTKYYQAKWAQEHEGRSFVGNVSGVVASGLFVALDNGVEGKLHISHLDDDYYIYIEEAQMLKGRSRGRTFRLGDSLAITISEVKPLARQIDFTLPEEGTELEEIVMNEEQPSGNKTHNKTQGTAQSTGEQVSGQARVAGQKVRARRRDDRAQERQQKLSHVRPTQPRFTLEEDIGQPQSQSRSSGTRRPAGRPQAGARNAQTSEGRSADNRRGRTAQDTQGQSGGRRRIVTLERSRSEHLRPVNITVQRMYFGDWSVSNLTDDDSAGAGQRSTGRSFGPRPSRETRSSGDRSAMPRRSEPRVEASSDDRRRRRNRNRNRRAGSENSAG